jgi:3-methyladenine DNA glycosylase AlkD
MSAPLNSIEALDILNDHVEIGRAASMADYHKMDRPYLGVPNPVLNDLAKAWRQDLDVNERVHLARDLWATNIFEARVSASKILTQARIKNDATVWETLESWVPDFDSWAIADHACMAGQRRVSADPARLDSVETWITSDHMWTRRAAFVITLPWTKQNFPKPDDLLIRDRVLGWAAALARDPDWFIQKAIAWWVRDLSKHDPDRSRAFLKDHGDALKTFARKEAARHLND